ncbi:hypothetical protein CSA56_08290 [candidate division KSB3 bacterium]|uniref:UspA domain-containing protein n=1 Tax=candidate division KSB3 bacterium TaxID=2044937 RepID=A0A2G6KGK5_9BACT|nr:MAG: hypothetical protein CSA56_08290 [candidate division KSB3 bacterium]
MVQYKKFLIPVDFSDHSGLAAKRGLSLAQMFQGTVYFLHAGEHARKSATRLSKFISHRLGFELPVPVKKLVAQGPPASTILSVAHKIEADAIVMGSRGASGLKHLVQGSVAEKVLRQSELPVFIIKQRKRVDTGEYMFPQIRNIEDVFQADKILIPLDFSPASKDAFRHAASIATRYNSTMYTLTVFDKKLKEYGGDHEEHTSIILRGEKIQLWKEFPLLLETIGYDPARIRLRRMLLPGDPFSRIEAVADSKEIDLIVMGTDGKSGLEHFLLGSVAEKVLRSLDCSIMTIRSQKEQ